MQNNIILNRFALILIMLLYLEKKIIILLKHINT